MRAWRWGVTVGLSLVAGPAFAMRIVLGGPPAPAAVAEPDVVVVFQNARPPEMGGDELELVGQVRSLAGIPYGTFTRKVHCDALFTASTAAALGSAGVDATVTASPGLPTLVVRLDRFWGDGNVHYAMNLDVELALYPPGATAPTWRRRVSEASEVTAFWAPRQEIPIAYEALLRRYGDEVEAVAADPAFRAALEGVPAAAVAPAGP